MDQNKKEYPYYNENWQKCGEAFAGEHIHSALTIGLSKEQAALVNIEPIATRPLCPLDSLTKKQSVRGLESHFLIKGVAFTEEDDEKIASGEAVEPNPIPMRANLPDGTVSADGLTPGTAITGLRLRLVGRANSMCAVKQGFWYSPKAKAIKEAADAAAKGIPAPVATNSAHGWAKARTTRRAENRKIAAAQKKAAYIAGKRSSDGELSDDSTAEVRQAVRRTNVSMAGAASSGSAVRWAEQDSSMADLC